VHKFGGASLADSAAVRHAVDIIRRHAPEPTVVVVSAMAGTTDALLGVAQQAGAGESRTVASLIARLRSRHAEVARALLPAGRGRADVLAYIGDVFEELESLAQGLRLLRELTPRTTDYLASRGERLSARLVAAALEATGTKAKYVDALDLVYTDGAFGQAAPDFPRTDRSVQRTLIPLLAQGVIPVVPGFIGATPEGEVATLGRGGSDLTATLLARGLGAARVSLWKDVPGLLTADPRVVPDARVIPQLHAREAAELAYYGAKVLHPRALIPVAGRRIPVYVRPFGDPDSAGTEVSERVAPARFPVKALTAAGGQTLVTVTGNGMLGVPGIAARTFHALHERQISVSLISQASSEHSICFSVPETLAAEARESLEREFAGEIARGEIDGVELTLGVATVAVVGLGMHGTPGVAAAVFSALAAGRINVVAIAQGSSELNISVVVDARQAGEAQRRIHAAFQLSRIAGGGVIQPERMEVVLLGFGQIGRTLATLIGLLGGGVLADVFTRRTRTARLWLMIASLLLCAPCLYALGNGHTLTATRLAAVAFGLFSGLMMGNIFPGAFEVVPIDTRASAVGVLNLCGGIFSGSATLFGGLWKQSLGIERLLTFTAVAYFLAGIALIVGLAVLFLRDYERASL